MDINEHLWQMLAEQEPEQVCARTGASFDAQTDTFSLPVLDGLLLVDQRNRCMSLLRPGASAPEPPGLDLAVAAANYLLSTKDIPLAHDWISPLELPQGEMFFRGVHAQPIAPLEEAFGQSLEAFKAAAQSLGGSPLTFADAAYEFPVFPRLPVAVLLWAADDEFPARARFLVDRTLGLHLLVDAVLGALQMVTHRLIQASATRSS